MPNGVMKMKIRINDIFSSINGEVSKSAQGSLCTFIRFQGCNLNCSYCDTGYSQDIKGGTEMSVSQIMKRVKILKMRNITITGGEPLLQREGLEELVSRLQLWGISNISIETNGSFLIPYLGNMVNWIADWKSFSSNMQGDYDIKNFRNLGGGDFIKFVVADKKDFNDAVNVIYIFQKKKELEPPSFAFAPIHGKLDPSVLVDWMLSKKICRDNKCVLNLQLHKIINVP